MEDGNLKLYVLKIILKKKVFDRVKKIVSDSFFVNGGRDIYKAISKIYEDNPGIEEISIADLRISYFETYFANQSYQAQKNIKDLIVLNFQRSKSKNIMVKTYILVRISYRKIQYNLYRIC